MLTMPRSFLQTKRCIVSISVFGFLMLVLFASLGANAQRRTRPATTGTQPAQQAKTEPNTQPPPQKAQKKNITPIRSGETSEGSRITITSDAPLNDYSAYRSGDRYYVVIPEANAPRAQGSLRGRGFEDVQVQKRGDDAVLSFKLQPGTNARVSQRFNRLTVELTTPGGRRGAAPTGTPVASASPTPQPTPRSTPQSTAASQTTPAGSQSSASGVSSPPAGQTSTGGNAAVVYAPSPEVSASPETSPELTPAPSPATEQIAQAQEPPTLQPATSTTATSTTSFGAVLRQNWIAILIAGVVLLTLVMVVLARSRTTQAGGVPVPASPESRRKKRVAARASRELEEAGTPVPVADILYNPSNSPKATPLNAGSEFAVVAAPAALEEETVAPVEEFTAEAEAPSVPDVLPVVVSAPAPEIEETKEVEAVEAADVERIEIEVKNLLAGDAYDESVIGAVHTGTRQVVATELLSALAGRNIARRDRAREAFVKHDYLDEATRKLRTAQAPAERAAAARAIGYVKDTSTTPHLVAALEDDAPEVRRAAVESLAELRDPASVEPLQSLLTRERDRKVPKNLIQRAIETCVAGSVEDDSTATEVSGSELQELTLDTAPALDSNVFTIDGNESQLLEANSAAVEELPVPITADAYSATDLLPGIITAGAPPIAEPVEAESETSAKRAAEEERKRTEELERQRLETLRREEEALRVSEEARHREEEEARFAAEARLQAEKEEARLKESARREEIEAAEARAAMAKDKAATRDSKAIVHSEPVASESTGSPEAAPVSGSLEPLSEESPGGWIRVDIDEPQIVAESKEITELSSGQPVEEPVQAEPFVPYADSSAQQTKVVERANLSEAREVAAQPSRSETEDAEAERGIAEFDEFSSVPGTILKRLGSEEANERASAVADLVRVGGDDSFREINAAFDDPAVEVRNAAVRSLFNLNSDRAATFTRALRESPPERRRKIGAALASSGLASEAIGQLMGESREKTYDAFSLLFLMSKAGEVQPLMRAIEEHPNNEVRLAVVKLLALSGQQDILPAFRRLAVRGSLPTEVRSAVMEAIYQISSQSPTAA